MTFYSWKLLFPVLCSEKAILKLEKYAALETETLRLRGLPFAHRQVLDPARDTLALVPRPWLRTTGIHTLVILCLSVSPSMRVRVRCLDLPRGLSVTAVLPLSLLWGRGNDMAWLSGSMIPVKNIKVSSCLNL